MFLILFALSVSLYTGAPSEPTTELKLGSESAGTVQKSDSGVSVEVYGLPVSLVPEDGKSYYGAVVSVYEPKEGLYWWAWYYQSIYPSSNYAIYSFLRESRIWSDSKRLAVFRHWNTFLFAKVSHQRFIDREEGLKMASKNIRENRDVLTPKIRSVGPSLGEPSPPRFKQGIVRLDLEKILELDFYQRRYPWTDRILFLQKVEWREDRFVVTYRGNGGRQAELHLDEQLRVLEVVYLKKQP